MLKRTGSILCFLVICFQFGFSQSEQRSVLKFLKAVDWIKSDSLAMISLDSISKQDLTTKQKLEVNIRILTRANFLQKFNKSVTVANQSILLAHQNALDSMEASFYEQLGNAYYYMENRPKAIEQYKKGVEIAEKNGLWENESACCNNMAAAYTDIKDYANGEKYLLRSIDLMMANGKEKDPNTHRTQRMLATLYTQTNRSKEAENMFLGFIERDRKIRDTALLASNLLYYSQLLSQQHDSIKATASSGEALELLRKGSDFSSLLAGMAIHSKNLSVIGKTSEAYKLMAEAFRIQKKSYVEDLNKQISEVEVKYKTDQILREKEQAEQNAKQKQRIYIASFIAIILFLIGVFYFLNQRKNAKQKLAVQQQHLESIIEGEEKERSRIAKDLHDGIVQDLTAIKLKLQGRGEKNEFLNEVSAEIDRAAKEVRDISYQMMPVALKEYGLAKSLEDLLQKMLGQKEIRFEFETVGLEERLSEKIEVCLYRITQELLNNVVKHSKANFVSVVISKQKDFVSLIFEDNGKGFDQNQVKKGIGMTSLSSRLDILNGNLKFETSEGTGTMAIIKIPLV